MGGQREAICRIKMSTGILGSEKGLCSFLASVPTSTPVAAALQPQPFVRCPAEGGQEEDEGAGEGVRGGSRQRQGVWRGRPRGDGCSEPLHTRTGGSADPPPSLSVGLPHFPTHKQQGNLVFSRIPEVRGVHILREL